MTRKRPPPTTDEVRCPSCQTVSWRRIGERVTIASPDSGGAVELRHEFLRDGRAWDWTCEQCGHVVTPSSRLDNALARIQSRRLPAIVLGLLGGGVTTTDGKTALSRTAQGIAIAAAVAVAGVALAVTVGGLGRGAATPGPAAAVTPAATPSGAVTSLAEITGAADGALDGRPVELADVRVDRVTGDLTFWIGDGASLTLVVLDESQQPEDAITVRAGQQLRISGTAQPPPPAEATLSPDDRSALDGAAAYIHAARVEVVGG